MTLARVWRRQLCAASGAALLVPCAMFAALVVLGLGGGFSQLGVLGQIFAGPPAPSAGGLAGTAAPGATRGAANSIPVIPLVRLAPSRSTSSHRARSGVSRRAAVPGTRTGVGTSGGALGPGGAATQPLTGAPAGPGSGSPHPPAHGTPTPAPGSSAGPPAGPGPSPQPAPGPSPSPPPTPVDQVVTVVTSVTSQIPGPVGSTATGVVQSVGGTADGLTLP